MGGIRLTTARLRALLARHGWRIEPGETPGQWRAISPVEHRPHPTPAVAAAVWRQPTYTETREIGWADHAEGGRLPTWVREADAPWAAALVRRPTNGDLVAYIEHYGADAVGAALVGAVSGRG